MKFKFNQDFGTLGITIIGIIIIAFVLGALIF